MFQIRLWKNGFLDIVNRNHITTMKQILILLSVLCFNANKAQVSNNDSMAWQTNTVLVTPEQMPEYPGGDGAMLRQIIDSLVYPNHCDNIPGKVVVSFIVNENGTLSDAKVERGLCEQFDAAVIEVLKKLKHFIPGYTNGKAVRTKLVLPIRFE